MSRAVLALVFLVLSGGWAAAQSHQESGIFIQGGVFAGFERESRANGGVGTLLIREEGDSSTAVAGGLLGGGLMLRSFLSARVEVALPGEQTSTRRVTSVSSTTTFVPADLLSVLDTLSTTSTYVSTVRGQYAYVLLAFHTDPNRRTRLALVGGPAFVRQAIHTVSETTSPTFQTLPGLPSLFPPRVQVQRSEADSVNYNIGFVVGLDAEIAFSARVALVPQIRVVGVAGRIGIRPGVSVRWTP